MVWNAVGQGRAGHGLARQGEARYTAGRGMARLGRAGPGTVGLGEVRGILYRRKMDSYLVVGLQDGKVLKLKNVTFSTLDAFVIINQDGERDEVIPDPKYVLWFLDYNDEVEKVISRFHDEMLIALTKEKK